MNSSRKSADAAFAGGGGIVLPVNSERDPLEALDDLMIVIEELCPARPHRETFEKAADLRL